MKNIPKFWLFALLLLAGPAFAQSPQFGDYEVVCWDSAGVYIALQQRVSSRNTDGKIIYTYYRIDYTGGPLDGKKVVPTVGTIGACGNSQLQQVIVNLQNNLIDNDTIIVRLDSLLSNTEYPQMCSCLYSIFLQNSTATVAANAKQPTWNFDRVVTRNCGSGAQEISRQAGFQLGNKILHSSSVTGLVSGSGVLDSMEVHVKNPIDSFVIYLSPAQVALKYPSLLTAIDTAHLRYNTATTTQMKNALTTVIQHAVVKYAISKSIVTPQYEFSITVNGAGAVTISFIVINSPSGPYINIRNGLYFLKYHRTGAGLTITNTTVGFNNSLGYDLANYTTPCGLVASVGNQAVIVDITTTAANWDTIQVVATVVPSQLSQTNRTCSQVCPEDDGCVEICNTAANPVPVVVIDNTICPVLGVVQQPLNLTSGSGTLPANTYNSISVLVKTGTVSITTINTTGSETASYSAGTTFSAKHPNGCSFLPTSFTINAASGSAVVTTMK